MIQDRPLIGKIFPTRLASPTYLPHGGAHSLVPCSQFSRSAKRLLFLVIGIILKRFRHVAYGEISMRPFVTQIHKFAYAGRNWSHLLTSMPAEEVPPPSQHCG